MMTDLSIDSPESIAWQTARSAEAAAFVEALPAREGMRALVTKQLVDIRRAPVIRRGDNWFQRVVLRPEDDHPVIVVRSSPTGEPRVLVDPNAISAERGVPVSQHVYFPSPDGTLLAYTIAEEGTEVNELVIIEVATGKALPDALPFNASSVSWLPDSSGFWLGTRYFTPEGTFEMPMYKYILGGPIPEATALVTAIPFREPEVSPDGRYVAVVTGNTEYRVDTVLVDGVQQPLLADVPGTHIVAFAGDEIVAIIQEGAPRGRVVRIPIATASDRSTWTELLAESTDVLCRLAIVADRIILGYLSDATCRIRVLDFDGGLVDDLELPGRGVAGAYAYGASHPGIPMFLTGDGEFSFVFSSFEQSQSVYRYIVADKRLELLEAPALQLEGLKVQVVRATSSDGAEVLAHVVHRGDLDLSVPQPTIIYGYGGYNLGQIPSYKADASAWIEAGGIWVLSHLRGGSEYGPEWWQQGSRATKQLTFDDLYAVAEKLIELGLTSTEKLAVRGESNGGLLTGAAIVQRPDLWAAVACDVPILDLLEYHRDPLTFMIGRVEYGDPTIPEEAAWLRAISPIHNVVPSRFPSVFVTAGANDPRCPPWHARVFVDLLDKAQEGDAPILLRVYEGQGHGAAGLNDTADKDADWMGLVANATGLKV